MKMEKIVKEKLRAVFKDDSLIFDKSRFAGGLTNYNYIMEINGLEYVVREPGGMTNEMIDRKIEKVNNSIVSELGVNSRCIYFDDETGVKISIYIKNSKNIAMANPCDFSNIDAVSSIMKKIHFSDRRFPNSFDFKTELEKYEEIVRDLKGDFFFDYFDLKNYLLSFMNENIKNPISLPCHNDTVPENFILDDSGTTYLIDWEYSGMNDPNWDIAAYILESQLDEESIDFLIKKYYDRTATVEEILKIKSYILAQDLLWTVWALIRHYNGDDFLEYCYMRYERFKKNMEKIMLSKDYPIFEMVKC